jgi:hypothetical protein
MALEPVVDQKQDLVTPWQTVVTFQQVKVEEESDAPAVEQARVGLTSAGFERTHIWTNQILPG